MNIQPIDDQHTWERLARKTRKAPLLFGAPRLVRSFHGMTIESGYANTVGGVAVLLFGIGACTAAIWIGASEWADGQFKPSLIGSVIFGCFGLLFAAAGFCGLLTGRRIVLDRSRDDLVLRYGLKLFTKSFRFPLKDLAVRLERASTPEGVSRGSWHEGYTVLTLTHAQFAGAVHLATHAQRERLLPAFDALRDVVSSGSQDRVLVEVKLARGDFVVPTTGISNSGANFMTVEFKVKSNDLAAFNPTLGYRIFLGVFMLFGVAALVLGVPSMIRSGEGWWALLPGALGALFIAIGMYSLVSFNVTFAIDRSSQSLLLEGRFGGARKSSVKCALDEIAAVQICSRYVEGSDGPGYTAWELNLVLANPDVTRLNLMSHGDESAVRKDAQLLADFLGAPLLDHTKE